MMYTVLRICRRGLSRGLPVGFEPPTLLPGEHPAITRACTTAWQNAPALRGARQAFVHSYVFHQCILFTVNVFTHIAYPHSALIVLTVVDGGTRLQKIQGSMSSPDTLVTHTEHSQLMSTEMGLRQSDLACVRARTLIKWSLTRNMTPYRRSQTKKSKATQRYLGLGIRCVLVSLQLRSFLIDPKYLLVLPIKCMAWGE